MQWKPKDRQIYLAERLVLAIALPMVAGEVNAIGLLALGAFTSHMTGNTTRIGDELAQGDFPSAGRAALMVGMFFFGAIVATLLMEPKRRAKAHYVRPLLAELIALAAFAAFYGAESEPTSSVMLIALLCLAMGIQNATVTHISGAVVRTTHLTGLFTDSGVEVGRLVAWAWGRLRLPPDGLPQPFWRALRHQHDYSKLRLHVAIIVSFLVGSFLGPKLFITYGPGAIFAPGSVLIILALFDALIGIRGGART